MDNSFGMIVREMRKCRGWTQAELADACRLSRVQISNIERGKSEPKLDAVYKICKALNMGLKCLVK